MVDDDLSIRNFIRVNLEARGYQVLKAADGEGVIRIAEKEKPELIILDIVMPGLDGFAVCGGNVNCLEELNLEEYERQ